MPASFDPNNTISAFLLNVTVKCKEAIKLLGKLKLNLPLHWQFNDRVKFAKKSFGPLPDLDVVTVGEAWGCSWRPELRLSPSLRLL